MGYDDNLFGSRRNRRSDGYITDMVEAVLESNWSRHAVGVTGNLEERRYLRETALDWRDWSVGAFGRYDFTPETSLGLRYGHVVSHLDISSVDVQRSGLSRPVPYAYDEVELQGATRFNRIGVNGTANYRATRYDDVELGGTPLPPESDPGRVSRNDFDSLFGAVGLTYLIAPGRYATLQGRMQDITYKESSQSGRDSVTMEGLAGFTYDFDGVWQARVAFGYIQRDYEGNFKTLSGPSFEGEVIYQPTLLTTLTFSGRRTIEESIRGNAVSFTRTQGAVKVDHEYLRNVILGLEFELDRREYEEPSEHATDGAAILSARWLLNRNLSLVASYQHARRLEQSSNVSEYDRNLIQLRLRIAL